MAPPKAPQSPSLPPEADVDSGTGAVTRQRRYRANKAIGSLDMARSVLLRLETLRGRTGLTNEQLLTRALDLFEAQQTKPARKPARRPARPSVTAEAHASISQQTSPVDARAASFEVQLDFFGGPAPTSVKRSRKN